MLADLVNGGGCLAEGSDSNNPLAKLSKSVVEGPASMGKQPMHHGQHDPLMGLQGGPSSSMNGTLPSLGPEEHAFMQAFHDKGNPAAAQVPCGPPPLYPSRVALPSALPIAPTTPCPFVRLLRS